jgi:hypothetical protein
MTMSELPRRPERRASYNTVEGIEGYLVDLGGLHRLIEARREAGYKRREVLSQFLILGRWLADSCGNFMPTRFLDSDYKPITVRKTLPKVIPFEERVKYGLDYAESSHLRGSVPPARIHCGECHKTWTIENADDCVSESERENVVLELRWGNGKTTLRQAAEDLARDKTREYLLGTEKQLRNDKYIDLTPNPKYETLKVNEHGWITVDPDMHIIEEGDVADFIAWTYFHRRCHTLQKARRERQSFQSIFEKAGLGTALLNEIPNEYHGGSCDTCAPWFIARLSFGDIKIGWRKRVIQIDWSDTGRDLSDLFTEENVTKAGNYIHAWGSEKAVDYLKRIAGAFA